MSREKNDAKNALSSLLGEQRDAIVARVRRAVAAYIGGRKPRECLDLVLRDDDGDIVGRLPMAAEKRYAQALIAFVRRQSFEGRSLDSALTDPTAQVVADEFSAEVGTHADRISQVLVPLLISDARFAAALSTALLAAYSGPVPAMINRKIAATLTAKLSAVLSQTIDSTTAATLKASIANLAGTTVSSPVAAKIATVVVGSLTASLAPILVKLLSTAAFKTVIVAKLKAVIIGAMLGAFIKIVGVKLGLTTASAFAFVLIPIVLAWIAYEITHFPEKLADKVSTSVAADMASNFDGTAATLAENLVDRLITDGTSMLASHLLREREIVDFIEQCVRDAA